MSGKTQGKRPRIAVGFVYSQVAATTEPQGALPGTAIVQVKVVAWSRFRGDVSQIIDTVLTFDETVHQANTRFKDERARIRSVLAATLLDFRGVIINEQLRYEHGDRKLGSSRFGCPVTGDLWLCFETSMTISRCRYRHTKLRLAEVLKITACFAMK